MKIRHNKLSLEDLRRYTGGWKYSRCIRRIITQNSTCIELGLDCLKCYVHAMNILKVVCK